MIIIVENYYQCTEFSAQEYHNIMILETIEFTKGLTRELSSISLSHSKYLFRIFKCRHFAEM